MPTDPPNPPAPAVPLANPDSATAPNPATASATDDDIEQLRQEFDALLAIKDPLKREYRLIQYAKASAIDTAIYKNLFEHYQEQKHRLLGFVMPPLRWLAGAIGKFTIFWGLILFIAEADHREDASYNEAWRTLNEVKTGETSSAGRIGALQTLTAGCGRQANAADKSLVAKVVDFFQDLPIIDGFFADCVSLQGLDVQNAQLPKIDLTGATLRYARLQKTGLWEAQLIGTDLEGAVLTEASLNGAVLNGAQLREARLRGADLSTAPGDRSVYGPQAAPACHDAIPVGDEDSAAPSCTQLNNANLEKADLRNANLDRTQLLNASLIDADLTEASLFQANLQGANLDGTILLSTDLRTARLPELEVLTRDGGPLFCNTQLSADLGIDANRDCDRIATLLRQRYPEDFASKAAAAEFIANQQP